MDVSAGELSAALQRITEGEKRREERTSEVIEMTVATGISEVIAEVDLS
jgi:hypothetical protein